MNQAGCLRTQILLLSFFIGIIAYLQDLSMLSVPYKKIIQAFLPTTRGSGASVAYTGCSLGWFCRCVVQFFQDASGRTRPFVCSGRGCGSVNGSPHKFQNQRLSTAISLQMLRCDFGWREILRPAVLLNYWIVYIDRLEG